MHDVRKVFALDLQRKSPPTFLSEIDNSGIDRLILSNSGQVLVYNASEKTYLIDFTSGTKPQLVHRFKAGDGIRTLQFSRNEKRLFMGTALGKWIVTDLDGSNPFPKSNEAGLKMNAYFKGHVVQAEFGQDDQILWVRSDDGQSALFSFTEEIAKARYSSVVPPRASGLFQDGYYVIQDERSIELRKLPKITMVLPVGAQVNSMHINSRGLIGLGLLPTTPDGRWDAAEALAIDPSQRSILARIQHKQAVNSAEISDDGQWLLSASEDNTARLLNLTDGTEQILGVSFKNGSRPIRKAMFSHQGQSIAVVIHDKIFIQNLFKLTEEAVSIAELDWFPTAGFSADDQEVFGSNASKIAGIYDVKTGQRLVATQAGDMTWNALMSQNGRPFASVSTDGYLRVEEILRNSSGRIIKLSSLPNRNFFLGNSGPQLAFSPNSRYIALAFWNGEAMVLDLEQDRRIQLPCSRLGYSSAPVFSADSQYLAIGNNEKAYAYHLPEVRPVHVVRHGDNVTTVGFHGKRIYTGSWDGTLKESIYESEGYASCED